MENKNASKIRALMKDEQVRSALWQAKTPDEAAHLFLRAAGAKAAGLSAADVSATLAGDDRTNYELSEAELMAVAGGMLGGDPNTGGHTQCCYHCYTK